MHIAMGDGGGRGSTQQTQDWTAWLMGQPLGPWLVGLVGTADRSETACCSCYRAFAADICKKLRCGGLSTAAGRTVERLGRAGYAARGVAFVTIGALLIVAATHRNPRRGAGPGRGAATLASQPFGDVPARAGGGRAGGVRCLRADRGPLSPDGHSLARFRPILRLHFRRFRRTTLSARGSSR